MNRIGAVALAIAALGLAAGPAAAELPNLYSYAKTMPEAMQQAKQSYQAKKLAIEFERKDVRKEYRRAFIACRGNDACEDAAEAARDRRYEELGMERDLALARLRADQKAIRQHFMRQDYPDPGTVAKPKKKAQ